MFHAGKPRLGFFNTALYKIAKKEKNFHDVTSGNNGSFRAAPGWDACTGLGSPDGTALLTRLQAAPTGRGCARDGLAG